MVVCGGKPDAILSVGTHYWKFNYWLDDDQRNCWLEPEYHAIHLLRQAGKCIARITKSTLLCFIYFPTPQSHFKVHCTHKFTFTSLQFWKKKNSFPFVISNFPVAFFIFSLLFLALPPEWKLKVGKLIDFLRFPSVQKKEKGLYGMIHILSFIDNHKSSPKENLCICSSAVAPAAIFFAPGVVSAVETKFNWICNAVNFFHVRRVRGPFLSSFSFLLQRKRGKVL